MLFHHFKALINSNHRPARPSGVKRFCIRGSTVSSRKHLAPAGDRPQGDENVAKHAFARASVQYAPLSPLAERQKKIKVISPMLSDTVLGAAARQVSYNRSTRWASIWKFSSPAGASFGNQPFHGINLLLRR